MLPRYHEGSKYVIIGLLPVDLLIHAPGRWWEPARAPGCPPRGPIRTPGSRDEPTNGLFHRHEGVVEAR
jgi:hypothetical protein